MGKTGRIFLSLGCAGLFGLGLSWIFAQSHLLEQALPRSTPPIDAFMHRATAFRYSDAGLLRERLSVQRWEHPAQGNTSQMTMPELSLYRPDGTIWHLTAARGIGHHLAVGGTMEYVDLEGEVRITHCATPVSPPDWAFETTQISLYATFAQTDQPVLVHGPEHLEIEAVGLKAYLDSRHVEFLHQVKSYYAIDS